MWGGGGGGGEGWSSSFKNTASESWDAHSFFLHIMHRSTHLQVIIESRFIPLGVEAPRGAVDINAGLSQHQEHQQEEQQQ